MTDAGMIERAREIASECYREIYGGLGHTGRIMRDGGCDDHSYVIVALAALSQPTPPGFRVVPVEPTEEMLKACEEIGIDCPGGFATPDKYDLSDIWAAMLSASPAPPFTKE